MIFNPPSLFGVPLSAPGAFGGVQVFVNDHLYENVGMWIETIPISRHRSKRIWKKLVKRRRQRAWVMYEPYAVMIAGKCFAPAVMVRALRESAQISGDRGIAR